MLMKNYNDVVTIDGSNTTII